MAEPSADQAALQEKLKNMSPEEIAEFQKKQCIFCQIVSGKIQSKRIYEDDLVLAIMDINPANPGHLLLLPKEHYMIVPQVPEDVLGHMFCAARDISQALLKSLGIEGTNIMVANGIAAGQKAQHMMIHIIPRKDDDGVALDLTRNDVDDTEMSEIQRALAASISKVTGNPMPEIEYPAIDDDTDDSDDISDKSEDITKVETDEVIEEDLNDDEEIEDAVDENKEDEDIEDTDDENKDDEDIEKEVEYEETEAKKTDDEDIEGKDTDDDTEVEDIEDADEDREETDDEDIEDEDIDRQKNNPNEDSEEDEDTEESDDDEDESKKSDSEEPDIPDKDDDEGLKSNKADLDRITQILFEK